MVASRPDRSGVLTRQTDAVVASVRVVTTHVVTAGRQLDTLVDVVAAQRPLHVGGADAVEASDVVDARTAVQARRRQALVYLLRRHETQNHDPSTATTSAQQRGHQHQWETSN